MMKNILYILVAVVSVLASGCATGLNFNVEVSGITGPNPLVKTKYDLQPMIKGVDKDDLQFQEFSTYVDRALQKRGFQKVEENRAPEIVIYLNYGISDPNENMASMPVFGQTGGGTTSTFNATTTSNTYSNYGSTTGNATTTGSVYTPPTFGVVGSQTYSYSTFNRFLVIDAVDYGIYKETEKIKSIWKTTITSTGTSGDLRRVFPVLVAAAVPHLGVNTGKAVMVNLAENKDIVKEIKGILEPEKEGE